MTLPPEILRQFFTVKPYDKLTTNGLSVIITIRGVSRQLQLQHCIFWALNQTLHPLEIIVVEEDKESIIDLGPFKDHPFVKHLFIKSDSLFCKSACYNHGVSNATYDYICGIDADLLVPAEFLMSGYLYLQKCHACFLADDIYYVECGKDFDTNFHFTGRTWKTHRAAWQFHGGTFFIRKQSYYDIGGHDENFIGYGSEDTDFYHRCYNLLPVATDNFTVLHAEHQRDIDHDKTVNQNLKYLEHVIDHVPVNSRINQLKSNNRYLVGDMKAAPVLVFPDILTKDIPEEIKAARRLTSKTRVSLYTPPTNNVVEQRRRRLLGL